MISWRILDLLTFKWLKGKQNGNDEGPRQELRDIWAGSLDRLAVDSGLDSAAQADVQEKLNELARTAKAQQQQREYELRKKAGGIATSKDLRAWWGEAVATWDPEDAKNIDSIEKKIQGPRKNHWSH